VGSSRRADGRGRWLGLLLPSSLLFFDKRLCGGRVAGMVALAVLVSGLWCRDCAKRCGSLLSSFCCAAAPRWNIPFVFFCDAVP
jgi:hypothetical protein